MSDFVCKELDTYTTKMVNRLTKEYPNKAKSFLKNEIGQCKSEATFRTPKGPTGNLKKGWRTEVSTKPNRVFAVLKNTAPHAHLIEVGHVTKNGGWVEGKHMLENTMTHRQPRIDANLDKLIDNIFDF